MKQQFKLSTGEKFTGAVVALPKKTARVRVRITRPTSAIPLAWSDDAHLRIAIVVHDGEEEHRAVDEEIGGGIRMTGGRGSRPLREVDEVVMCYTLTHGFFGARKGFPKRLGEVKRKLDAHIEVEMLAGTAESEVTLEYEEEDAPKVPFHSSVAFDAASALTSTATGTTMTVTHTATGTNKAALIAGWFELGTTTPTGITATYGGNAAAAISGFTNNPAFHVRHTGLVILDAGMPAGAQSVVVTRVSGSGTLDSKGITVTSLTGVNQTTPTGTAVVDGATTDTTLTVTVATPAADSQVVDSCFAWTTSGNLTPGANQTLRASDFSTVADFKAATSTQLGSLGGTVSYTKTLGDEYGIGAVEFFAAADPNNTSSGAVGPLTLSGKIPTINVQQAQRSQLPAGVLSVVGHVPTLVAPNAQLVEVPVGALAVQGRIPHASLPIAITIQDATGASRPSLSGLKVSIWDQQPVGQNVAPDQVITSASTDASGILYITLSFVPSGSTVWVAAANSAATQTTPIGEVDV